MDNDGVKYASWMALSLFVLAGCGSKDVTVVTGDGGKVTTDGAGNMTVTDKDGNKVNVQTSRDGSWSAKSSKGEEFKSTKDGISVTNEKGETATMGLSSVSEQDLSLPFYPGSSAVENRDMRVQADGGKTFLSVRTTRDAPSKVLDFYKGKVKDAALTSTDKFGSINGKLEDGRNVMVMALTQDSGVTEIQISVSTAKN